MVFSGYIPWSGVAGSYDGSTFRFLRNLYMCLYQFTFPPTVCLDNVKEVKTMLWGKVHNMKHKIHCHLLFARAFSKS